MEKDRERLSNIEHYLKCDMNIVTIQIKCVFNIFHFVKYKQSRGMMRIDREVDPITEKYVSLYETY